MVLKVAVKREFEGATPEKLSLSTQQLMGIREG